MSTVRITLLNNLLLMDTCPCFLLLWTTMQGAFLSLYFSLKEKHGWYQCDCLRSFLDEAILTLLLLWEEGRVTKKRDIRLTTNYGEHLKSESLKLAEAGKIAWQGVVKQIQYASILERTLQQLQNGLLEVLTESFTKHIVEWEKLTVGKKNAMFIHTGILCFSRKNLKVIRKTRFFLNFSICKFRLFVALNETLSAK